MKGRQAAFEEAIQEAPVIAAVKNDMGLAHALRSECAAVFILYGTILDIGQIVKRIKAAGKLAFVHADLIEGLSNRGEIAVDGEIILTAEFTSFSFYDTIANQSGQTETPPAA